MTQNPRGSISNAADAEKGHRKSSSGGNPLDGDNNKSIDEAIEPQHKESRFKPRDEGDQTTDRNRKDSIVDPGSENQGGPVNRISGSNAESMVREPIGDKKKGDISSMHVPQETKVGKKLSDLTTKRVITLVMSVMVSVPVFTVSTFVQDTSSGESGLKSVY